MKEKDKEITINDLANKMDQGFKTSNFKFVELTRTIDDLAAATASGFINVQKQFDKVNQKLEVHDQRFDQMDKKIDSVRIDLSKKIETEIVSVKAEISLGFREVKEEISLLDTRIEKNRKSAVRDVNELVIKSATCELDRLKIKQKIAKLKLAN